MSQRSPIIEEALKRIRTGEHSPGSKKRRRTSKGLLILDAVLIIIILLFFYNKEPDTMYKTTSFNYRDIAVRISLTSEKETGDYLFSLTLNSRAEKSLSLPIDKSLATINLYCDGKLVTTEQIGPDMNTVSLKKEESKTYARIVNAALLTEYAREHHESVQPRKKSLIQLEKQHIPVRAEITLNTAEPVAITLDFKHGVSL